MCFKATHCVKFLENAWYQKNNVLQDIAWFHINNVLLGYVWYENKQCGARQRMIMHKLRFTRQPMASNKQYVDRQHMVARQCMISI